MESSINNAHACYWTELRFTHIKTLLPHSLAIAYSMKSYARRENCYCKGWRISAQLFTNWMQFDLSFRLRFVPCQKVKSFWHFSSTKCMYNRLENQSKLNWHIRSNWIYLQSYMNIMSLTCVFFYLPQCPSICLLSSSLFFCYYSVAVLM